jgi:ribonuclease J
MTVRLAFLGGLGEVGRNCATLEIDGRLAMVDCGLMFPEEDMLGVDLVLPDFTSVLQRSDDLACVVLTHGHEDHIGALSYLLREVNVPVYGTPLTLELARPRLEDAGIVPDLRVVEPLAWVEHGPFRFSAVPVSHSVPNATGLVFDTPEGIVVHSGDFKLDPTPIDGVPTDLQSFARLGAKGVRLLLADSTNAEREGYVPTESSVGRALNDLVAGAEGRVIMACFASHIHRVQQAIDAVVADGRKFAFIGRSMIRNSEIATRLGVLDGHGEHQVEIDELLGMDPSRVAIISTGSQGEPYAALSLMAIGEHASIALDPSDTVIISATPIPGNETRVSRVINNLMRSGVTVFHGRNSHVHVSGHAAQEELKTFYNVVRPKALVPVHGEYRHLAANAALGRAMGIADVIVCTDGDAIVIDGDKLTVDRGAVPAGYVYVDGPEVGGADEVLRDRRHLADDGVLIVTVGVDKETGEIVVGPDVDSHGVTADEKELHDLVARSISDSISALENRVDPDSLRRRIRNRASKTVRERSQRRPVVIPIVIEV